MVSSKLDHFYRSLLLTKFFVKGWGKPENLHRIFSFRKRLADKETCYNLINPHTPVEITNVKDEGSYLVYSGHFSSPFDIHLPGLLPDSSKQAHFQMILPHQWKQRDYRPVCIHLAGTGDHGYWKRRTLMARPLLHNHGIGSILLENPFYGCRKPPEQKWSCLLNVSDLFVMGGCLIMECAVLFHWCRRQRLGPVGLSGISMGGHMASIAACSWPRPVPLVPCLSWTTASGVFTQGVLSGAINWELLKDQYFSNKAFRDELFNIIHSPEGHFSLYHEVGQNFAKNFPDSMDHLEDMVKEDLNKEHLTKNDVSSPSSGYDCSDSDSDSVSIARRLNHDPDRGNVSPMTDCVSPKITPKADSKEVKLPNSASNSGSSPYEIGTSSANRSSSSFYSDFYSKSKLSETKRPIDANKCSDKSIPRGNANEVLGEFKVGNNNNKKNNNSKDFYCKGGSIEYDEIPPRFSHIDCQSNALNALSSPSAEANSGDNCKKLTEKNDLSDVPQGTVLNARSGGSNLDQGQIASSLGVIKGVSSTGAISTYGLQSIREEIPAIITSAVVQTSKFGEKVGRRIINSFSIIGSESRNYELTSSRDFQNDSRTTAEIVKPTTEQLSSSKLTNIFKRYRDVKLNLIGRSTSHVILSSNRPAEDDPHLGFTPVGIRPVDGEVKGLGAGGDSHPKLVYFKPYRTVKDPLTWEAIQFMRGIMDECTHVGNFGHPTDTNLIIIIRATRDAYVPCDSVTPLPEVWPGSELRTIDTGHIQAFVLHQDAFRQAISDAFQRTYAKYADTEDWTEGGKPPRAPQDA